METTVTNTDNRPRQRNTRQRQVIWELMRTGEEFLTAQQVHALLREQGETIGLATVYRTLQGLQGAKQLDSIHNPDGEAAYRRCSPEHHHHLICRLCGKAVEVAGIELEDWTDEIAKAHGYSEPEHFIEIYGICSACR